ncbi:glycosyltransferase family 2 protein [Acinetobacter sp. ANC 4636]
MIKLTVFTPTFNRSYILPQLFESLQRQTNKEFIWLIVDDGSTDNTRKLIEAWQATAPFDIQYIYQENQGMHGAHNTAYEHCITDYNICIDSDDYMPDNAVEKIIYYISDLQDNFAGIVGLDANKETKKIIGSMFPAQLAKAKLNKLYSIYNVTGDKKLVYRTSVIKKYPKYPIFKNESFVPLDYLYLLIDQDYDLKPINEVFCIVEYQDDGSTKNIFKQYMRHPNGFAFSRISRIKYGATFKERFKNAIHLVSSSIFAKDINWLFKANKKSLVILAFPFGVVLNIYIRMKA